MQLLLFGAQASLAVTSPEKDSIMNAGWSFLVENATRDICHWCLWKILLHGTCLTHRDGTSQRRRPDGLIKSSRVSTVTAGPTLLQAMWP